MTTIPDFSTNEADGPRGDRRIGALLGFLACLAVVLVLCRMADVPIAGFAWGGLAGIALASAFILSATTRQRMAIGVAFLGGVLPASMLLDPCTPIGPLLGPAVGWGLFVMIRKGPPPSKSRGFATSEPQPRGRLAGMVVLGLLLGSTGSAVFDRAALASLDSGAVVCGAIVLALLGMMPASIREKIAMFAAILGGAGSVAVIRENLSPFGWILIPATAAIILLAARRFPAIRPEDMILFDRSMDLVPAREEHP